MQHDWLCLEAAPTGCFCKSCAAHIPVFSHALWDSTVFDGDDTVKCMCFSGAFVRCAWLVAILLNWLLLYVNLYNVLIKLYLFLRNYAPCRASCTRGCRHWCVCEKATAPGGAQEPSWGWMVKKALFWGSTEEQLILGIKPIIGTLKRLNCCLLQPQTSHVPWGLWTLPPFYIVWDCNVAENGTNMSSLHITIQFPIPHFNFHENKQHSPIVSTQK